MLRTSGKTSILLLSGPLIGKYLYFLHKIAWPKNFPPLF